MRTLILTQFTTTHSECVINITHVLQRNLIYHASCMELRPKTTLLPTYNKMRTGFLVFSKQLIIIFLFANLVFGMHVVREIVLHENRIDCTIIS